MGKNTIFTKEQQIVFDQISSNNFICSNFYFTGGTALSNFYLQHRLSEDLDFFSTKTFQIDEIEKFIQQFINRYSCNYSMEHRGPVYIYLIQFKNGVSIKLDFSHYPYQLLIKGLIRRGIIIDSLFDIAVNKLETINQRASAKDFVDLYFLLKVKYSIWDLMSGVERKFHIKLEPLLWAADLLSVEQVKYLPKMIKPLNVDQLKSFFREQAVKLGRQVTK